MSGYSRHYIPKLVKVLRGRKPQREIAEAAGISISYLSDIERGRTEPTLETLESIFKACGARLRIAYVDDRLPDEESDWLLVRKSDIQTIAEYANGILTRYQGDVNHVTVSPEARAILVEQLSLREDDFENT